MKTASNAEALLEHQRLGCVGDARHAQAAKLEIGGVKFKAKEAECKTCDVVKLKRAPFSSTPPDKRPEPGTRLYVDGHGPITRPVGIGGVQYRFLGVDAGSGKKEIAFTKRKSDFPTKVLE